MVISEAVVQHSQQEREAGLPYRIQREDDAHRAGQRIRTENLRGHERNQHVACAEAETERKRLVIRPSACE